MPHTNRAWQGWTWAIAALLWVYSWLHFVKTGVIFALGNFMGDFLYNFPAPKIALWANASSIYFESPTQVLHGSLHSQHWSYGPLFHIVSLPLLFLGPLQEGYRLWLVVNYAFLIAGCWLLYRLTAPARATLLSVTAFVVMVLNYHPLYEALIARNIELFEWLLVVGAMTCYAKRRDAMTGILMGLATMTKFLPGWFILYFALKRRWRAFWAAVIVTGAIGIVAQSLLGWQHNTTVLQLFQGGYAACSYSAVHSNLSVAGVILRLTQLIGFERYWAPVSQVCIVILAVLFLWFLWRVRFSAYWKLEWSLIAIAMITLLPHNQPHYLIFLLIPYAVLWEEAMTRVGRERWRWIFLLVVSWALTAWPIPLSLVHRLFGLTIEQLFWLPLMPWGIVLLVWMVIKRLNESIASRTKSTSASSV